MISPGGRVALLITARVEFEDDRLDELGRFLDTDAVTRVTQDAALVGYDASGREIGRVALFAPHRQTDGCFTDPAGNIGYGTAGNTCCPAFPWR